MSNQDRSQGKRQIDLRAQQLLKEPTQTSNKVFVCVDFDHFFTQVEMKLDPSLKGKPVAVGGIGMLSTANYEARKYGVRSAMPGHIALKLCPHLLILKSNSKQYQIEADTAREIFAR